MPLTPAEYINDLVQGHTPTEQPPSDPPWSELATRLLSVTVCERRQLLSHWVQGANGNGDLIMAALVDVQTRTNRQPALNQGRCWNVGDLLEEDFGELPVLVGDQRNALLVRGEGHLIVGPPGIGKTLLIQNMALHMAFGENFLGFNMNDNINVLILQAELPLRFLASRFHRMVERHQPAEGMSVNNQLRRIYIPELRSPIDLMKPDNRQYVLQQAQNIRADVIVIDPFLPFFRGEENSNSDVRKLLDTVKYEVAERCNCALIITDHISKTDTGEGARARGASAKIDWAATVINLTPKQTPQGQCDKLISAKITKMRHGLPNEEPIILRLDRESLSFSVFDTNDSSRNIETIRLIISEAGGKVQSQRMILSDIKNRLGVGDRRARSILNNAIQRNIVLQSPGRNRSMIYRLTNSNEGNDESSDDNNQ